MNRLLMNTIEIQKLYGISRRTVYRWSEKGFLPYTYSPVADAFTRKRKSSLPKQKRKKACATAESALQNKQTISSDKSVSVELDILSTESSATSDQDSTTDDEDSKRWWI